MLPEPRVEAEEGSLRGLDTGYDPKGNVMKRLITALAIVLAASLTSVAVQRGESSKQVEWLYYGGDQRGTKYSPLTDVNPGNIQRLQISWQWKHFDAPIEQYKTFPGQFESTPLMIDGILYVTTPYNNIAALDAGSGKESWRFDAKDTSSISSSLRADGSCGARHSGATAIRCGFFSTAAIGCSASTARREAGRVLR
jgi:glucose dehydrogenase